MEENTQSALIYIKQSFELKNLKLYKEAIEMLYKALSCEDIGNKNLEIIAQIGDLYMLLKNYERAIEQYERVLDKDKNHIHSMHKLCEIYFILQKYSKALDIAQKLCTNSNETKNFINYFRVLYKLNMFDEIKALYAGMSQEHKNNDEIMYIVSKVDTENAIKLLEKIISINPKHIQAKLDLGIIKYNENAFDDAKLLFESILDFEKNSKVCYFLGSINEKQLNYSRAVDYFLKAIKYDSTKETNYYFELAKAYCDLNWLNEAQTAIVKSLSLISSNRPSTGSKDEHYFLLSWILSRKNDTENALINLELIDKGSPIYKKALILLNTLKFKQGDIINAKLNLEKLYNENEDNPILFDSLAQIYKELKLYKKAIEILKIGLSKYPDSVSYLSELVDILIDDKNYNEAFKWGKDFIQKYPNCPSAYNSLARLYYRLKDYDNAIDNLKKLTQLDKNNAEGYYFLGLALNDASNHGEALENLTVALNLDPTKAKYYAQVSRSYMHLNQPQNAILFIKEAIELAPEDISYKKQAAMIFAESGNQEEAAFYNSLAKGIEQVSKENRKINN